MKNINTYLPAIKTGLLYGIILGILFILISNVKDWMGYPVYESGILFALSWLSAICVILYFAFTKFSKISLSENLFLSLIIVGLIIAFTSSIIAGADAYISSAYLNPDLLDQMMEGAKENWQERGYSTEVIQGQAEHTMYSDPFNYAFSGAQFLMWVTFIISFLIALVVQIQHQRTARVNE